MTLDESRYEEAIDIVGRDGWEELVQAIEEQATDLVEEGEVAEDTELWELKEIAENIWDMYISVDIEVRLDELELDDDDYEIVYERLTHYTHAYIRHIVRQSAA